MSIFNPSHIKKRMKYLGMHIQNARIGFTKRKRRKKELHTLIIVIAIIFIRRGVWGLLDAYLLPSYPLLSMIISVIVGLIILYMDDKKFDELAE